VNRVPSLRVSAAFRSLRKTQDQSSREQEFCFFFRADVEGESQRAISSSVAQPVLLVSDQTMAMEFAPSIGIEGGAFNLLDYFAEVLGARR
jgi:hypothetical protein